MVRPTVKRRQMKHASKAAALTVSLILTSGCSQSVPPENNVNQSENNAGSVEEGEQPTTTETVIAELLPEMPDHAPYVNANGIFNTRDAARVLYESGNYTAGQALSLAEVMESEWIEAFNTKSAEVQTRV